MVNLSERILSTFHNVKNLDFLDSFQERDSSHLSNFLDSLEKPQKCLDQIDQACLQENLAIKRAATASFGIVPNRYESQNLDDAFFNLPSKTCDEDDQMLGKRKPREIQTPSKSANKSQKGKTSKSKKSVQKSQSGKKAIGNPEERHQSPIQKQLTFGDLDKTLIGNLEVPFFKTQSFGELNFTSVKIEAPETDRANDEKSQNIIFRTRSNTKLSK